MKLVGHWCTQDIDNEHLGFRIFSTTEKNSKIKFGNDRRYIVFLERAKEISNKEYEQCFKEQFYLSELMQITWCINVKQTYGRVSDLIISDYENIFDYSFDFNSMLIDKGVERKIRLCFNKLSKYKKLPVIYLNIYQRYIDENKWYLQGYFYFHWLEIQQVGEVLEKIKNEIAETQSYPN